jgi:hypothetical protein
VHCGPRGRLCLGVGIEGRSDSAKSRRVGILPNSRPPARSSGADTDGPPVVNIMLVATPQKLGTGYSTSTDWDQNASVPIVLWFDK